MSNSELKKVDVIRALAEGRMVTREAAAVLDLSERQVKRLKAGLIREGENFVVHKNKGREPKNKLPEEVKQKIILLVKTKYMGENQPHLIEMLAMYENINVSQPTISRILKTVHEGFLLNA